MAGLLDGWNGRFNDSSDVGEAAAQTYNNMEAPKKHFVSESMV